MQLGATNEITSSFLDNNTTSKHYRKSQAFPKDGTYLHSINGIDRRVPQVTVLYFALVPQLNQKRQGNQIAKEKTTVCRYKESKTIRVMFTFKTSN